MNATESVRPSATSPPHGEGWVPVVQPAGPATAPVLPLVAASLAHNVNNALTAVIAHLELGLREVPAESPVRQRLDHALCAAGQAAKRVRRLAALAVRRPERPSAATVSLRQTAEEAAADLARFHPEVAISTAGTAECLVRGDATLLRLVLEQIVCNAVEAMPCGGRITFTVRDEGHRCCLSVTDTGVGLGPEVRRQLFEPFFTTKFFGHLGVGLALCREIIEAQGGAIHLYSAEGQGTTVTLSFPPAEDAAPTPALSDQPTGPTGWCRGMKSTSR